MNRRFPRYPDDADYQTNAPSYYEDLARKQKLIQLLTEKIWEYEETLDVTLEDIEARVQERFSEWDERIESFPDNVESLLQDWLTDGTLDHIINDTIFNWKADKTYVDSEIERLDQKDEEHTTLLTETYNKTNVYTPEFFGAVGDGVADDTEAFKTAFNSGLNITLKTDSVYRLTNPIYLTNDNVIIDFNNAKIIFDYDQSKPHSTELSGRVNWVGVFNAVGVEDGTFNIDVSNGVDLSNGQLNLTTPISNQLKEGDFIRLDIETDTPSETTLGFKRSIISKVVAVENTALTLDYLIPKDRWNTKQIPSSLYSVAKITRIKPIKNIQFLNLNMEDITVLRNDWVSGINNVYPNADSHYAVTGIQLKYVYKPVLRNIHIKEHMFNAIYAHYVHSGLFEGITSDSPRLYGPGEGYLIQNIGNIYCNYNNLHGIGNRHTIDFTDSAYCKVDGVTIENNKAVEVQFHGVFEHDIELNDVRGLKNDIGIQNLPSINFGSGLQNFGNAVSHIDFYHTTAFVGNGREGRLSKNISFNQSYILLSASLYDATFNQCTIYLRDNLDSDVIKRGLDISTRLEIKDSLIKWYMPSGGKNQFITDYDELELLNSEIVFDDDVQTDSAFLTLENIKTCVIENLKASLTIRPVQNKDISSYIQIKNSQLTRNHRGAIEFQNITDGTMKMVIKGNDFLESSFGSYRPIEINLPTVTAERVFLYIIQNMSFSNVDYSSNFSVADDNIEFIIKDNLGISDVEIT